MSSSSEDNELPYNPKNKVLQLSELTSFLQKYDVDIPPNNIALYRKAFVTRSYLVRKNQNLETGNIDCPEKCIALQEESLERQEFLGDKVVGLIVGDYLFDRYPNENEGFLTNMTKNLVNGKMLAYLSKLVGFSPWLIISKQIEDSNGRDNTSVLEDTFEAFVGAIFKDYGAQGFEIAQKWLISVIENNIDFAQLVQTNTNYKDKFLKFYQQNFGHIPKFFELGVDSKHVRNGYHKVYRVSLRDINDNVLAIGTGTSKKNAENNASFIALKTRGLVQ